MACASREAASHGERERGLSHATRSDQFDERTVVNESGNAGDVSVTPHEIGREGRQVAARLVASGHVGRAVGQHCVVVENLALDGPQLRTGFEPEIVGEPPANALAHVQRIALATGPVQRADEQGRQARR